MKTEYEVMFLWVDVDEIHKKIDIIWASSISKRQLYKRKIYAIPGVDFSTFVRVRDEGDKVTLTIKSIGEDHGADAFAKELETVVGDFDMICQIVSVMWMKEVRYEENYRTKREINQVEICFDERPGVSPYIEIEWPDESSIQMVSELLWYEYDHWVRWNLYQVAEKELWYTWESFNSLTTITFKHPLVDQWR